MARADVPTAPLFDATMFVSASSLNLLMEPSTSGRVIACMKRDRILLPIGEKAARSAG